MRRNRYERKTFEISNSPPVVAAMLVIWVKLELNSGVDSVGYSNFVWNNKKKPPIPLNYCLVYRKIKSKNRLETNDYYCVSIFALNIPCCQSSIIGWKIMHTSLNAFFFYCIRREMNALWGRPLFRLGRKLLSHTHRIVEYDECKMCLKSILSTGSRPWIFEQDQTRILQRFLTVFTRIARNLPYFHLRLTSSPDIRWFASLVEIERPLRRDGVFSISFIGFTRSSRNFTGSIYPQNSRNQRYTQLV